MFQNVSLHIVLTRLSIFSRSDRGTECWTGNWANVSCPNFVGTWVSVPGGGKSFEECSGGILPSGVYVGVNGCSLGGILPDSF